MKKLLSNIFWYGIPCLMIAWIALSWLEVVTKNSFPNPEYSVLNLFEIICKIF